ncbi:3-Beta-hydroxysteroid-delta(8) [Diplonema papillatum]|nr:3-Beta-hydroxysteroid-delta(8) [Diplonema papillatum]
MGIFSTFDPSTIFCISCIIIPLIKDPATTNAERIAHVTDPWFLASIFFILIVPAILVRTGKCVKLSDFDRARGRWYLWNAAIIHFMMDGGVGFFEQLPLLGNLYKQLDQRFVERESCAVVVTGCEFFFMTPFCLAAYWGIRRGSSWTYAAELVACTLHFIGTVVFCGAEALDGFKSIPTDFNFEFTQDKILYFWFGFGINIVWLALPVYFGYLACAKSARLIAIAEGRKQN